MLLLVTDDPSVLRLMRAPLSACGVYWMRAFFENAERICDREDVSGVILDGSEDADTCAALARQLRASYPDMPIAAILPDGVIADLPADAILRYRTARALCEQTEAYCEERGWKAAPMTSFELSVGVSADDVFYMGYPLPLSETEYEVLRCLFYRSSRFTTAETLLALCYRGKWRTRSNIPVVIYHINLRAAKIDPRRLIVHVRNRGYRLRDGILDETENAQ